MFLNALVGIYAIELAITSKSTERFILSVFMFSLAFSEMTVENMLSISLIFAILAGNKGS